MGIKLDCNVPLQVGYEDRARAKALGVKPFYDNGEFLYWYAPPNTELLPLIEWLDPETRDILFPQAVSKPSAPTVSVSNASPMTSGSHHGQAVSAMVEASVGATGVTLERLLTDVKGVISKAFGSLVWVRAEVVNISAFKPHAYLELSDYDNSGRDLAKARAMVWGKDIRIIKQFEEKTGVKLKGGVKILCQVKVEFSEKYGLSLKIVNIDEKFTLGDMEAKLMNIKNTLLNEGVFDKNKRLQEPMEFTRVAVVAPHDAAGLGDFMSQADVLVAFGVCQFDVFNAKFQGNKGHDIVAALQAIENKISAGTAYDAIVVIRGGGDKAGIYELNEYHIAKQICLASVPVIVGIGHERDTTILDDVSCIRCATPSLVIGFISTRIINNAKTARAHIDKLSSLASEKLQRARMNCERLESRMLAGSVQQLATSRRNVELRHYQVVSAARNKLVVAREQVNGLMLRAVTSDPSKIVSKGYAYVIKDDGKVVGNGQDIHSGESFSIHMRDGRFNAIKV